MDDQPTTTTADAEDTHTTDCMSARIPREEIITRGERRRVWSPEQKRQIVVESLGPVLTPTEVARKYGIGSGLLYTWRRQVLGEQMMQATQSAPSFTQVAFEPAQADLAPQRPGTTPPEAVVPHRPPGLIEIVLPDGVMLRVDASVDEPALRRVLAVLSLR
jgi:transposase